MGVYSDWAETYYDSGIFCVPCGENKAPIIGKKWEDYCDKAPTHEEIVQWASNYHYCERLGLVLGQSSGFVAFDFDYEYDDKKMKMSREDFDRDKMDVEKKILALLPDTPCIKVGKKGWTRIYKWNDGLSNKQLDRNGIRLFDFLAWHKQTIIPPSLHSVDKEKKTATYYKWVDQPIEHCLKEIPEISMDTVDNIYALFDKGDSDNKFNNRHGRLFWYIHDVLDIEKDENKIIKKAIEYDLVVNQPAYLTDKKHVRGSPERYLEDWIFRIKRYKLVNAFKGKMAKTHNSKISWDYFFENSFHSFRKDILTDKIHVKANEKDAWVAAVDIEGVLRSYASRKGLARSNVLDELERWSFEKKDKGLLIDFPEWDGVDRIKAFADAVHSPVFNHDEINEILSDWGAKVFHRIYSKDSPVQNRCPILKGGQGLGKDTWARNLVDGFGPYYQSVNLSGTQKDMLEVVSRLLIIHVEEFDQTANVPIAFLKDLITKPQVFFRESYGRSPAMRDMMASWISTANVDDVLRDPTGNRRFIVIPVDKIDWNYPQRQSAQVYAQFYQLFKTGTRFTSDNTENKIKQLLEEYTPDALEELIVESYAGRIETKAKGKAEANPKFVFSDVETMFSEIAKNMGCSVKRVQSVLKASGYQKKIGSVRYYYASPQKRDY